MTRFRSLMIAAAVATAFAAPTVLAQQGGSADPSRTPQQRDGTGMPSGSPTQPPGAVSQDPANDPNRRPGSDRPGSADPARTPQQRDATGMPSGSPTQPPGAASRDRADDPTMRGSRDRSMGSPQYGAGTVREVQQALQNKGHDVGAIDGVMGPRTESALRDFQQKQGLTRSGRIDAQTLSALEVQPSGRSGAMRERSSTGGTTGGGTGG
jgi:N-acetylmuramoyl-L-alanine amidase